MKFLLILLLLGVFAAKASLNAQEQDEGELSQEYPEEYPAGMVDEDEVSEGELQEESEDELSEDELAVEGEKPVGDGWVRAGVRGGRIIWKYRRPIRHVAKRVFSAFRRGRRRKFRRELQEESEDELSEDSEEMEIADGEDKVSDDFIITGGIAAGTLAYRNRNKIKAWFRRRSRRRKFRRSLAEEEVSDDDDIACFGACISAGLTAAQMAYKHRQKIGSAGRHVGGWFKRRRGSRRRGSRRRGF